MKIINLRALNNKTEIPRKMHVGDAGYDVVATSIKITEMYVEYGLGFSAEIPEGVKGVIVPRSSISKKDLIMCNSPAQIDQTYKDEWMVRFKYINSDIPLDVAFLSEMMKEGAPNILDAYNIYKVGDRIAQIYFEEVLETHVNLEDQDGSVSTVVNLSVNERQKGSKGFGSTGDR